MSRLGIVIGLRPEAKMRSAGIGKPSDMRSALQSVLLKRLSWPSSVFRGDGRSVYQCQ